MRLTPTYSVLPLVAAVIATAMACEDGGSPANNEGAGGDDGQDTTPATSGTTTNTSAATTPADCYEFESDSEGWSPNYAQVFKAEDSTVRDETLSTTMLNGTVADWMSGAGYGGDPGFLQLSIPYQTTQSSWQSLVFSLNTSTTPLQLKGKTVTAQVKVVSGGGIEDASNPPGAKLTMKSNADYFYADGGWNNLKMNNWVKISLTADAPAAYDTSKDVATFDANNIFELGIQFDTNGSATSVTSPAIIQVDHICIQ